MSQVNLFIFILFMVVLQLLVTTSFVYVVSHVTTIGYNLMYDE